MREGMMTGRHWRAWGLAVLLVGLAAGVGGAAGAYAPDDAAANAGWEEVGVGSASGGGISQSINGSTMPVIALAPNGNPVIAWTEKVEDDWEIYIRRWDGQSWAEIGSSSASGNGISDDSGDSESPVLAIAPNGSIIVAWANYINEYASSDIFVRRWDGSSWREMGTGSASGGGISQTDSHGSTWPTIAIDSDGMPIIAWSEQINHSWEIYIRRWNGTSWVEMGSNSSSFGGISNNPGFSIDPSLAISNDGTPIIAWGDNSGGDHEIYVRRWDGTSWVETNSGSAYGAGISDDYTQSTRPSLAIYPNGKPIIAWENYTGGDDGEWEIFAQQWDGTSWVEMDGSASGGGISHNSGISLEPSLAILSDRSPIVAWMNTAESEFVYEIYVRRWNGSTWVEAGDGSASVGGVSDGTGSSQYPSLAIGPNGRAFIAWHYLDGNLDNIFVRQSPKLTSYRSQVPILLTPYCFSSPFEVEPNNGAATANGPLCAAGTFTGLPNDARDFFMFETTAAGRIAVEVSDIHVTGMQLALYYQSGSGQPVAFDTEQDDGLRVEVPNAQLGRYFIRLYTDQPNPAETRPYFMQVTYP